MDIPTIITILGPIGAALYFMYRLIDKRFDKIEERLEKMEETIRLLDQRISRLEGAFLERGQWEGRIYSMQRVMTEDKK